MPYDAVYSTHPSPRTYHIAAWFGGITLVSINEVALCQARLSNTWMGDCLQKGKPSLYVTSTQVNSAFYPPWNGKMSSNKMPLVDIDNITDYLGGWAN